MLKKFSHTGFVIFLQRIIFSVSFFTASINFLSDHISRKAQSVTAQKESLQAMCSSLERDILYCSCKWFTRSRLKMVYKSFTDNRVSVLASTFLGFLCTNMYKNYFLFHAVYARRLNIYPNKIYKNDRTSYLWRYS